MLMRNMSINTRKKQLINVPSEAPTKSQRPVSPPKTSDQDVVVMSYRTKVKRIDLLRSQIKLNQTKTDILNDTAKSTIELASVKENKGIDYMRKNHENTGRKSA